MTRLTRVLATAALFAAVLALLDPPRARANLRGGGDAAGQIQQPIAIPGGGTELFRALLDKEGVQPVTLRDLNNNAWASDDLIVVVVGTPNQWNWPHEPLSWVRKAVQANGAALIASDSGFFTYLAAHNPAGNQVAAEFKNESVVADWAVCHRQEPKCPYVVPVSPDELRNPPQKPGPVWGLFRGLSKLATNDPTYIQMHLNFRDEYAYPLARLPKSAAPAWGGPGLNSPLFAVGGDGPQRFDGLPGYSFLAMADSSVLINQMLMEQDADNLEFALRTVDYLQGPQKHRKKCLFFENGRIVEKFDGLRSALAKPKPKIPPEAMPNVPGLLNRNQDKLVDLGNKLADQFQTKDGLHNMLVGRPGSPGERRSFGWWLDRVLVLAAVVLVVVLLARTLRARAPVDLPPTPTTGAGAASTGPPGVFDRRQRELVRRNNLYEPVRNLMREFFDAAGAPPNPGPRLPTLEISDVVRKPGSLHQAIRDMWRIAYGPPQPISAQRWFELEPYFERLRKAHADGKWRFVPDDEL